ncbi:MAG TPA: hypothetical protein EYG76_01380 [Methanothermococcus okinawensis]|uniref:Uncharacterized protein n=1 Tax=Methanothermococcus okinawensis TaxID=155863 RepID=A0A832YWA4_9EURY|nr:hypothetical protein [Methanothermococcus okinawensis]
MILLKFYKNIFILVMGLLIFGYFLNFMDNNPTFYKIMGLQNSNTNDILNVFNVNKYVEYSKESLNLTEKILNNGMTISDNASLNNSNSTEEINKHMEKYNAMLDEVISMISQ